MAQQIRIEYPGAFYHVTSRGNERKPVFKSKRDREKFLEYLESASERYEAVVHLYCLMDNHILCRMHLGSEYTDEAIRKRYKDYFKGDVGNKDRELTDGKV